MNKINVAIISGSCCFQKLAVLDEQAKKVIENAVTETGIEAEIIIIPAANAIYSGTIPKNVINELMDKFSREGMAGSPAILINGEVVSYGVPQLEGIKAALEKFKKITSNKQEQKI